MNLWFHFLVLRLEIVIFKFFLFQILGRWFWIHSLKPAEFLPWGVWQPDGDKTANFGAMFAGFDYRWTDETSAFEYRGGAYPICQFIF